MSADGAPQAHVTSARKAAPPGGIKVGLEIHQQLATGKLFCRCPSDLEEKVSGTFVRRLRATKSEMGEVDQAALAETRKGKLPSDHAAVVVDVDLPVAVASVGG